MNKFVAFPLLGISALALSACDNSASTDSTGTPADATAETAITVEEIDAARQAWGEGIVAIGQIYTDRGDYTARATEHINQFYGYEDGMEVLFKPTLAVEDQFRGTFDEALSYFVGREGTEDPGFATMPFSNVRWENEGTIVDGDSALAMGNYYFTGPDGNEIKVEYTFGFTRNDAGEVVINLHHSSLPYSPPS